MFGTTIYPSVHVIPYYLRCESGKSGSKRGGGGEGRKVAESPHPKQFARKLITIRELVLKGLS